MEFPGPCAEDLAQVARLNRAFLDSLAGGGLRLVAELPIPLATALRRASPAGRERLSRCPFLLFSLGERDAALWAPLFEGKPEVDLFTALDSAPAEEVPLVSAALAYLWRFASHNPYAARVVSGAPAGWCEQLAGSSLVELYEFARRPGLMRLRRASSGAFWQRLVTTGMSDEPEVRRAARIWALQAILTRPPEAPRAVLPAAACRMPVPALSVAERSPPSVSQTGTRRYNTPPHEGAVDPTTREDLPQR